MNIVIVGAGNVGRALGRGWHRAGRKVTFAVRDPSKRETSQEAASVNSLKNGRLNRRLSPDNWANCSAA